MLRRVLQRRYLQTNLIRNFILKNYSSSVPAIIFGVSKRWVLLNHNEFFNGTCYKRIFHTVSSIRNKKKIDDIPLSNNSNGSKNENGYGTKAKQQQLMIAFTCKKCNTRSSHTMSKQAYTKGTVLIQCPGCKNRHLIADHLKIFNDHSINIEDILRAKGENVSQSTEDLVLEDIPEKLKPILTKYVTSSGKEEKIKGNKD